MICELANDDGTVMKGPQIDAFAREHGLARISVADLIAWRQEREHLVERVGEFTAASPIGELRVIAYATPFDSVRHFAFVHGDIDAARRRAGAAASVGHRRRRSRWGRSFHAALERIREAGPASSSICATAPPACR